MTFVPKLNKIFQICLIFLKGNGVSYIMCIFLSKYLYYSSFNDEMNFFEVPKIGQFPITIVLKEINKMIKFSYILTVYELNFHFITYFCHIF